jgi:CRP/FNR family cyclic AMP-dependent transcriptional regulator
MPVMADTALEQTLAGVPLLASLDRKTLQRLAEQGKRRRYAPGETIVREGEPASALYVILSGKVRVERREAGGNQVVAELVPGDFFGELALIEEEPRTATVTAVDDTECILFVAWEFTALLKANAGMAYALLRALIERIHRREHHLGR